jgi:hypothetical protein
VLQAGTILDQLPGLQLSGAGLVRFNVHSEERRLALVLLAPPCRSYTVGLAAVPVLSLQARVFGHVFRLPRVWLVALLGRQWLHGAQDATLRWKLLADALPALLEMAADAWVFPLDSAPPGPLVLALFAATAAAVLRVAESALALVVAGADWAWGALFSARVRRAVALGALASVLLLALLPEPAPAFPLSVLAAALLAPPAVAGTTPRARATAALCCVTALATRVPHWLPALVSAPVPAEAGEWVPDWSVHRLVVLLLALAAVAGARSR